ncbi:hypothetical protein PLESTB_000686400 [Pleodorina starrii]|uniref:Uncharacterized protein n=1 Tax=Pleodorina starrii TaxID=330485 RepID=A0A9W6F1L1_9CHLO|nr:hypothetical protein PLESTB_000686400 [Pleodorina starrii]
MRHQGTRAPGHQGTRAPGHQGTRAPGHQGTRAPGHQGTRAPGQHQGFTYLRGSTGAFVRLRTLPKARRPVIATSGAFRANANPNAWVDVAGNIYDYYAARPTGSTAAVQQGAVVGEEEEKVDTPCTGCGDRECDGAANVILLCSTSGCPVVPCTLPSATARPCARG